jgi:hypothetical protein
VPWTNVFLNPYQQPENKLTYNLLCLVEHCEVQKLFLAHSLARWFLVQVGKGRSIEKIFASMKTTALHFRRYMQLPPS